MATIGSLGLSTSPAAVPSFEGEKSQKPSLEPIIEPELPIIDAHHHLWFMPETLLEEARALDDPASEHRLFPVFRSQARYLLDELLADAKSGHNVRGTVFVEVGT